MRALWSSFGLDCTGELADRATCALARGKTPVRTGVEWRMRGTHHQGEATRLGHEPCASRRDHVAPEAAAVVPAHAPDRARKKCNPLRTNNLRSTNYPNPRKKRNPCATTTYAQSTPATTPSFTTNPRPAQKRNPLSPNTQGPIRLRRHRRIGRVGQRPPPHAAHLPQRPGRPLRVRRGLFKLRHRRRRRGGRRCWRRSRWPRSRATPGGCRAPGGG